MRYAVIDFMDCVFFESDSVEECFDVFHRFGRDTLEGIFDYQEDRYLDIEDIIDRTGVQIHNEQ